MGTVDQWDCELIINDYLNKPILVHLGIVGVQFNTNEGDNAEPAINVANYSYSIAIILSTTIFQL